MLDKTILARALLCLVLLGPLSGVCFAGPIWVNGSPNGFGGNNLSDTEGAEDFILSVITDLTGVTFWDMEVSAADYSGSIFWETRSDSGGIPGTVVASGTASPLRTPAGSSLGYNIVQNDFSISVPGLAAGTYWLVLHNGPLSNNSFTDYYWAWTDLNATNTGTNRGVEQTVPPDGNGWTTTTQEHAFTIHSDPVGVPVPEPASVVLLGSGLMLFIRRRRTGERS